MNHLNPLDNNAMGSISNFFKQSWQTTCEWTGYAIKHLQPVPRYLNQNPLAAYAAVGAANALFVVVINSLVDRLDRFIASKTSSLNSEEVSIQRILIKEVVTAGSIITLNVLLWRAIQAHLNATIVAAVSATVIALRILIVHLLNKTEIEKETAKEIDLPEEVQDSEQASKVEELLLKKTAVEKDLIAKTENFEKAQLELQIAKGDAELANVRLSKAKLEEEKGKIEEKLAKTEADLEANKKELSQTSQTLKEEKEELKSQLESAKESIQEHEHANKRLENERKLVSDKLSKVEQSFTQKEVELAAAKSDLERLEEELSTSKKSDKEHTDLAEQYKTAKEKAESEIDDLKEKFEEAEKKAEEAEKAATEANKEKNRMKFEKETAYETLEAVQAQLDECVEALESRKGLEEAIQKAKSPIKPADADTAKKADSKTAGTDTAAVATKPGASTDTTAVVAKPAASTTPKLERRVTIDDDVILDAAKETPTRTRGRQDTKSDSKSSRRSSSTPSTPTKLDPGLIAYFSKKPIMQA